MRETDEEILMRIWANRAYFSSVILKRIFSFLNPRTEELILKHKEFSVSEIFYDSIEILSDKYLARGKIKTYEDARKCLNRICILRTHNFVERYIDQYWYEHLTPEERELELRPPSYYYHKRWHAENREHYNKVRRAHYQRNKLVERKKIYARLAKRKDIV